MYRAWQSLTSKFKGRARTKEAELRLVQAYIATFRGSPSRQDQEMVLADLANASSWRKVCPPSVSSDELRYVEGARSLFSRIFAFLSLSEADVEALEMAVRQEAVADETLI